MKKISDLFKQHEFSVFLFLFCFLLFSWPFLVSAMTPKHMFYFLFIAWAVIIVILYGMARKFLLLFEPESAKKPKEKGQ